MNDTHNPAQDAIDSLLEAAKFAEAGETLALRNLAGKWRSAAEALALHYLVTGGIDPDGSPSDFGSL